MKGCGAGMEPPANGGCAAWILPNIVGDFRISDRRQRYDDACVRSVDPVDPMGWQVGQEVS